MKHFIQIIGAVGGLLISLSGLSQTILDDELNPINPESMPDEDWYSESKIDHKDPAYLADKSYVAGTYTIFYPASGFSPINSHTELTYHSAGCSYRSTANAIYDDFDLQLQIPVGHEIRGMWFYYYSDTASTSNASLYTINGSDGSYTLESWTTSIGDSGYNNHYTSLSPDYLLISNSKSYSLRLGTSEQGSSQRLCGIRLLINATP